MTSGGVRRVTLIEKKDVVDTMDQSIEVARPTPLTKATTKKELPPPFMEGETAISATKAGDKNSMGKLCRYGGAFHDKIEAYRR